MQGMGNCNVSLIVAGCIIHGVIASPGKRSLRRAGLTSKQAIRIVGNWDALAHYNKDVHPLSARTDVWMREFNIKFAQACA